MASSTSTASAIAARILSTLTVLTTVSLAPTAQAAPPGDYTAIINRHIETRWKEEQVTPAEPASDAEFLRRVWLDIAGKAPPVGEVRAFLEDDSPDKRQRMVRRLLKSPHYIERFSAKWLELLTPEIQSNNQLAYVAEELRSWLRKQALQNVPYDDFVREILSVPLASGRNGAMAYYSNRTDPLPTAFYAAKETAPENLAASTARVFLGIRVDCAQCHDHPFADWKQEDFWSYAAYYQGLKRNRATNLLVDFFRQGAKDNEFSIAIPEKSKRVPARFLDKTQVKLEGKQPRQVAAEWVTSAKNPYFSRAMVNRTWSELLGRGLVDPVDDMDALNEPSHPELLTELSEAFAKDFDVPMLIEGIVLSAPYQISSRRTHSTQESPELFGRFLPRRLDSKQVHATLTEAFSFSQQSYTPGLRYDTNGIAFKQVFDSTAPPLERTSSVQQSLLMMNGQMIATAAGENGKILRAWLDLPGATEEDRVDMAYLSILSRMPRHDERKRMLDHLKEAKTPQQGLADICWALVNSSEFMVNH